MTPRLGPRKHLLLTKELERKLPALYSTENLDDSKKKVVVKFFSPWSNFRWYVIEGQRDAHGRMEFFGYVTSSHAREFGYFTLDELERANANGLPLVERDKWFDSNTTLEQVKQGEVM